MQINSQSPQSAQNAPIVHSIPHPSPQPPSPRSKIRRKMVQSLPMHTIIPCGSTPAQNCPHSSLKKSIEGVEHS